MDLNVTLTRPCGSMASTGMSAHSNGSSMLKAFALRGGTIKSPQALIMPEEFQDIAVVNTVQSEVKPKARTVMVPVGAVGGTAGPRGWQQAFDNLAMPLRFLSDKEH